jgi:hypothetical protein
MSVDECSQISWTGTTRGLFSPKPEHCIPKL